MHVLLIVAFAGLILRDQLRIAPPGLDWLGPWAILGATVLPMVALAAMTHGAMSMAGRVLDTSGQWRALVLAQRALSASRWAGLALHLTAVLALGWLDAVRAVTGDLILADELLAMLPLLAMFTLGWASFYSIERRIAEAAFLGSIDDGRHAEPLVTRGRFVSLQVRHQILLVLVPMSLLIAWNESAAWAFDSLLRAHELGRLDPSGWLNAVAAWLAEGETASWVGAAVQLTGVLIVLTVMPLIITVIWEVEGLPSGPLSDRMNAICRGAGVRPARVLIWRTASTLLNGAVIGLAPATRIILLTDALLERLPMRQVEGVMAHELGHVRRRHIVWLGVTMLGSIGLTASLGELAFRAAGMLTVRPGEPPPSTDLMALGLSIGCLLIGLVAFGFVSRRFEWQADAFAVQTLSRTPPLESLPDAPDEASRVAAVATDEAVDSARAMLESVARINHIRPEQFSWRHGSIAERIRRIEALRGVPLDRSPIDRHVRWVKAACAAAAAGAVALVVWPPL